MIGSGYCFSTFFFCVSLYDSACNPRLAPPALPLHLLGGQLAGARPSQSVLHRRQQSPHYPIPLQGRSACWTRLRRRTADTQQDQGNSSRLYEDRGEHLDVALWHYGRGRSRVVSIAEAERISITEPGRQNIVEITLK